MTRQDALKLILAEYDDASSIYGPFHSAHEGYAVIKEELEELWDAIKAKHKVAFANEALLEEATQVGAMALRFLVDCCELANEENTTEE